MAWTINWEEKAFKELKKLDHSIQKKILKFLNERIANLENPRAFGKPLSYDKVGLWRYRVEDFRIVCRMDDDSVVILVVQAGHRKEVYEE